MRKKIQMPHMASRMQLQYQNMSLSKMLLIALIFLQKEVIAQTPPPPSWEYKWESVTKTVIELDIRKFGANPDDEKDDTWAFMKASWYIANLANMDGVFYVGSNPPININYDIAKVKLKIPAGSTPQSRYIVGLQQKFSDQTSNTDLYTFYDNTAPNTLHCGGTFSRELPYKFIFNSVNSSSWTESGTTYYSYPDSTYTKTKTITMLYELTTDVYQLNIPPTTWWKNDFDYNSNCGTDKIVGATLNIIQPNQRRVCSTANLQYQLHDPVTCVQTASLPYTAPLYNMTFPYTVSTEIFAIDNDKNTYINTPERRPKNICIEGVSNGSIEARMEYSPAVVGVTDALGNKHDISDLDQAPLWPNINACNDQANAFNFRLVDSVEIKNFEIDGNVEQHIRKGSVTADGIQQGATGLELNTTNTTIKDMYVHHMAIDGIAIKNGKCTTEANIYGNNIRAEYNGRVGLAYGSGRKARFDLSKFNHQGSAMSAVQSDTQCWVAFASGVNFEDEGFFCLNGTSTDYNIEDIEFNNCEFNFNASSCVHNDAESQAGVKTRDITFNNCTFHKVKEYTSKTAYGFWIRGENFVFNNCKIWCNVFGTYGYNKPGAETKFIECDFEDKPYDGLSWDPVSQTQTLQNLVWATSTNLLDPTENYLLQNTPVGSYKPLFQKCNFKINDPNREFMSLVAVAPDPLAPNSTEAWSEFDNCTFEYKNNGNTIGTALITLISRAKFRNNNKFMLNYLNAGTTCGVHKIKMKEVNFEGSNDACNPNTTEFIGMIDNQIENDITVGKKNNSSDDGYAKLEYKNKALLHFPFGTQNLNIGPRSSTNIYASAGILTSNIKLNGEAALVLHDGAYIHQTHPSNGLHTITGDANSLLFVSPNINPNGSTVHPDYTTSPCVPTGFIGQPWIANNSIVGQVCVQGGNTLFVSTANANACTNVYSHISTNGPFSVMYNVTNPLCYGGNGQLDVSIIGGVASTFEYSINNGATFLTMANPLQFPAGNYNIIIKDANGATCGNTFSFVITELNSAVTFTSEIKNKFCDATLGEINVQAGGGIAPYTYNVSPNAGVIQSNNIFTNLAVGTYTVSVTDANGCVKTSVAIINEPQGNHCCSPAAEAIVATPNVILLSNTTASDIRTNYNSGSNIVIGKTFYIDGTLTIDEDITFDGCTMWFAPLSSILVPNGTIDFNVSNSTLQATCDYWEGIVSIGGTGNKVNINNNSYIKNAKLGLYAWQNAIVTIDNAHFEDNANICVNLEDMTLDPYPGYIRSSTFTSQANLPAPYDRTVTAILLFNVKNLRIGGLNPSNQPIGNTFDGMKTGINNGVYLGNSSGNNEIIISHNTFSNIHADDLTNNGMYVSQEAAINGNGYTNAQGTAVYNAYDAMPNYSAQVNLYSNSITNCDKALINLNANMNVSDNTVDNCQLGLMHSIPYQRIISQDFNTVTNAHIGMAMQGNPDACYMTGNVIQSNISVLSGAGPIHLTAPIGIKLNFSTQTTLPLAWNYIAGNLIEINDLCGVGINNMYGDSKLINEGNEIKFTTNSSQNAGIYNYNIKSLFGIFNDACLYSSFNENSVLGNSNSSNAYWNARDTKGIYFNESQWCEIRCNKAKYTRFGFLTRGRCETSYDKVTFNKFNANAFPWYFTDGSTEGTFGNVGSGQTDNYNEFLYAGGGGAIDRLANGGFKVFRNSSTQPNFKIYTDPSRLIITESGPLLGFGNPYLWQDPQQGANYTDPCVNDPSFIMPPDDGGLPVDLEDNTFVDILVANGNVSYLTDPDVAIYNDSKKLYIKLLENADYRNSDAELLSFYNATVNSNLGKIVAVEKAMQALSAKNINRAQYETDYAAAWSLNTAISANNNWEANEKSINYEMLRQINVGIVELDESERNDIEALAKSCVYTQGPAVYKARTLWSNFEPSAIYDDRVLCLNTSNKAGNGSDNVDSLMLAESGQTLLPLNENGETIKDATVGISYNQQTIVTIYPNPAQNQIHITKECKSNGVFTLYNRLGQVIASYTLTEKNVKVTLPELAQGVYNYKCEFENCDAVIGKLTIVE